MALDFPSNPVDGQVYDTFIYNAIKGTWQSISTGASPTVLVSPTITSPTITNAVISATATNSTTVPVTVKGAASQSANLQEWKNSSGTTLSSINASGQLTTDKVNNTGFDFTLGSGDQVTRGNSGASRALVKLTENRLSINYAGDFAGGTVIDSALSVSGKISAPTQPSFFAYRTDGMWANQTWIANLTYFNVGGNYNTSNGRFTAPVAGKYFFGINAIGNTSGTTRLYPRINGNTQFSGFHLRAINTGNYGDAHMTWIYNLAAGDYVDILLGEGYNYSDGTPYAYWHGFLLH